VKPIDFHPDAAQEARDAAAWYDERREGLSADFRRALMKALVRIQLNPSVYAADENLLRTCRLRRFPYSLIFEELDDRIWIAAVAHQSRRPGYWSGRARDK
jgi:plasmid stabilization system protein ParE